MASIDQLRASDGSGNANVATVQSSRAPAASTIVVDTVVGINGTFMGTMGTPHTFVDPVTSEQITVISEATAVDFSGHVDGANLEIDAIAPGYTDLGSEIGDIVIIRPTTQWSDNLADVLAEIHEDSGTLKPGVINLSNFTVEAAKGWYDAGESWSYGSWTAGTRIGTITVPTNATTKYTPGMRIRISQATGGTKYGIIHKVEATTLHVFFPDGTTLNNQAISSPSYSIVKVPFGFDADPSKWELKLVSTTNRTFDSATPVSLIDNLVVGVGAWDVFLGATLDMTTASGAVTRWGQIFLSTDAATQTDVELTIQVGGVNLAAGAGVRASAEVTKPMLFASQTTLLLMGSANSTSADMTVVAASSRPTIIRVVSGNL